MKKNKNNNTNGNEEESKKKERHIVSWTPEEDGILREQIRIHGTENWSVITSKFKDKSTRQCRRRWFTYLNSDFKKGGWSPEEDMLLCEAQKIFGNRWTEIAKVVSGRTDNAVKNRFTTLCKKREKYAALARENGGSCINSNNKRILDQSGMNSDETIETAEVKKMRRSHIPSLADSCNFGDRSHKPSEGAINQQLRAPFAVLAQNFNNVKDLPVQNLLNTSTELVNAVKINKMQGTFLKKDDPKIIALMQQAELLSSLAERVNAQDSDQNFEGAWKVLHNILDRNTEGDVPQYETPDTDFQVENFKDLVVELSSSHEGCQPSWSQPNLYESPSGSDYSTGSNIHPPTSGDKTEQTQFEMHEHTKDIISEMKTTQIKEETVIEHGDNVLSVVGNQDVSPSFDQQRQCDSVNPASPEAEFNSPVQVTTPLFRTSAAEIPSPQFSESERRFLMKTLGMESPSTNRTTNTLSSPPCKRVLLNSL